MKVSILTDEISQDPATAVELAHDWGIKHLEIRGLLGRRIPDDDRAARRTLLELMSAFGIDVAAISPGLFKVPLSDRKSIEQHLEVRLPNSVDFAKTFGTSTIIVFTPMLNGPPDRKDVDFFRQVLARALDVAERNNVTLALENEPICLVATGSAMSGFVRGMGRNDLRVNWDPGNAYYAGEDLLDGYRHLKGLLAHVHLKDAVKDKSSGVKIFVPIGSGELPIHQQVRLLKEDGYGGHVTVETHFSPRVKGSRECLEGLKTILSRIGERVE